MWCTEQFHTQQDGIELYLQQTATSLTQTVIFLIHNHHLCSSWHNSNRDQRFICPSPSTRVPLRINCMLNIFLFFFLNPETPGASAGP